MQRKGLGTEAVRGGLVATALAVALAGCTELRSAVTGECVGQRPITVVMIDGSATQADPGLLAEQVDLVAAVAQGTSEQCGRLRVERFRGSASDVDTILDRDVTPKGATDGARAGNRVAVVDDVRRAVEDAMAATPARGGSDPLGAMARGGRLLNQDKRERRQLVVVTDGVQSHDPNLATAELSAATATRFVDSAGPLPDLSGIDLVVTGVGRVSGAKPPTSYVNGLVAFYTETCRRSGATSCQVTDAMLLRRAI
ncbi:MAG: hypothetical protein ACR2KK_22860 [Acidimicrobiales bacterium]